MSHFPTPFPSVRELACISVYPSSFTLIKGLCSLLLCPCSELPLSPQSSHHLGATLLGIKDEARGDFLVAWHSFECLRIEKMSLDGTDSEARFAMYLINLFGHTECPVRPRQQRPEAPVFDRLAQSLRRSQISVSISPLSYVALDNGKPKLSV